MNFINTRRRCKRTLYPCYEKSDRKNTEGCETKVSAKMLFMRRLVLHQMELEPLTPAILL